MTINDDINGIEAIDGLPNDSEPPSMTTFESMTYDEQVAFARANEESARDLMRDAMDWCREQRDADINDMSMPAITALLILQDKADPETMAAIRGFLESPIARPIIVGIILADNHD